MSNITFPGRNVLMMLIGIPQEKYGIACKEEIIA